MARSTVHYADNITNNALKKLHNKLRPAGTPVQRVEYIIELLLLRIFETKLKQDEEFRPLRKLFSPDYKWKNPKTGKEETNENRLFSYLASVSNDKILAELNDNFFPFYSSILYSARQVFKNNLTQKVQDQLVLIEEVFGNSNFTNNVNSGNLGEIISIIANDIEEERLLKTDLLGDAIESALSETGGTKDLGLFRTPGHIRQFMTALVEPTFDDIVFDPACGTGGFLFDVYEYVMQRYSNDKKWPGEKSHTELKEWFEKYFEKNPLEMPSESQSIQFYRNGVAGIEYLGMIRKMAAINFYIRGLNPANIEQGDSLAKFNPVVDKGSKSIVLANPPFGAERDQEAYPDVWSEYAKESETTILFVKLMFELLKNGGKCAVVVSEGFLTWEQFSAKALRKMLLDEANLRAIISLPQGLFVSKGGVGPKTSILLFEKGGKTDWVWFYKVTNDGYTMGTNRKEQPGNQLVDCLNIYHKYIKFGKKPKESKNQFIIPGEWIKTLDPRIKEKIKVETRIDMEEKGKLEKQKKEEELIKKIKLNRITEEEKLNELKVFDQMLENKIQNEIAKRIDKAHNYSFKLSDYKSTLSESKITEWNETLKHIKANGPASIDEIYKKLSNDNPENILSYLKKLNPVNALAFDIAREYVYKIKEEIMTEHRELAEIKEIIKSGAKYPMVKLGDYIILNENKIKPSKNPEINYKVLGVSNETGIFINDKLNPEETNQSYFLVKKNEFCYNPYRINVGSIGLNTFDYDNQIISGAYIIFSCKEDELSPLYLDFLFKSKEFLNYVNEKASGGVRMNFGFDFMREWVIPLPTLGEQNELLTKVIKLNNTIQGANNIINNWEIQDLFCGKEELFGDLFETEYGYTDSSNDTGNYRIIRITDINKFGELIDKNKTFVQIDSKKNIKKYLLHKGDILIARTGATFGKMLYFDSDIKSIFASYLIRLITKKDNINTKYIWYFSFSQKYWKQANKMVTGGTQPQFNANKIVDVKIPLPNINVQNKIVKKLDNQIIELKVVRKFIYDSESKLNELLNDLWSDNKTQTRI